MHKRQGVFLTLVILTITSEVEGRWGDGRRISCCFIDIFCATSCLQGLRALHQGQQIHRIRHHKHLSRLLRAKRHAATGFNLGKFLIQDIIVLIDEKKCPVLKKQSNFIECKIIKT